MDSGAIYLRVSFGGLDMGIVRAISRVIEFRSTCLYVRAYRASHSSLLFILVLELDF